MTPLEIFSLVVDAVTLGLVGWGLRPSKRRVQKALVEAAAPSGEVLIFDQEGCLRFKRPQGHPDIDEARRLGWTVQE